MLLLSDHSSSHRSSTRGGGPKEGSVLFPFLKALLFVTTPQRAARSAARARAIFFGRGVPVFVY